MYVYNYRRGYNQERLDPFTELQDNDIIRVVLRDPQELIHPQTTHYGCRTYNPLVTQTEYGISKFFSILKFLVGNNNSLDLSSMLISFSAVLKV